MSGSIHQVKRPGQRQGFCLMAGKQDRQDIVDNSLITKPATIIVPRRNHLIKRIRPRRTGFIVASPGNGAYETGTVKAAIVAEQGGQQDIKGQAGCCRKRRQVFSGPGNEPVSKRHGDLCHGAGEVAKPGAH